MIDPAAYDEFGLFAENAEEIGIEFVKPTVKRVSTEVEKGRNISALVWGDSPPELVFLHGGAQNAHTWDTVALALGRPLLAIDLPGHGHSDRRGGYPPGPGTPRGARRRDTEQRRPLARHGASRARSGRPGQRAARVRVLRGDGRRGGSVQTGPPAVRGRARRPAQRPPAAQRTLDVAVRPVRRPPLRGRRPHRAVGRLAGGCSPRPASRSCRAPGTRSRATSRCG